VYDIQTQEEGQSDNWALSTFYSKWMHFEFRDTV